MAELLNRAATESEFRDELRKLQSKQRGEIERLMGNPPDAGRIPASYWERHRHEIEILLLLFLGGIFASSVAQHGGKALAGDSEWAKSRAADISQKYADTTREKLERRFTGETKTKTSPPIEDLFGDRRAESVVASETTAATSAGGEAGVNDAGGVSQQDKWHTEQDARVCPICSPLEGTPRSKWGRFFPSGPPAHIRCRCWIEYVNVPPATPAPDKPSGPSPKIPGSTGASLKIKKGSSTDSTSLKQANDRLFGSGTGENQWAMVAGVPDGSKVEVVAKYGATRIEVQFASPDGAKGERTITKLDDGRVRVRNDWLSLPRDSQGQGKGTKMLADQVENAAKAGVSEFITYAATDPVTNGHYTWARLGYDGPLSSTARSKAAAAGFQNATNVSDLMRTPEGRAYWKREGESMDMVFNLAPGSASRATLDSYVSERFK